MSRVSQSGTNNVPLGRNRLDGSAPPPPPSGPGGPARTSTNSVRKRRNRWDDGKEANKAMGLIGLTTAIQANMTIEQMEAYALHLRMEEITQKLKIGDVAPDESRRSPSPPPQYDNFGRRVNTADARYRQRLEDERHRLVEKAMKTIPDFKPPSDYRRPNKTQDKIYVPVNDYPEINFIGLLIGPRGNTLKSMESKSGAKIAIRGKGSVKEGKGRTDPNTTANLDEDLHCLVMADSEEKVNAAIRLIEDIIATAASTPEGQNKMKLGQLRELASLNGTLRDDENQVCQNCGEIGHRRYDCPTQKNFTAGIICRLCGNAGHMARDCKSGGTGVAIGSRQDQEYESLMNELGEGSGRRQITAGSGGGSAPWDTRQQRRIEPAPWENRQAPAAYSAPPPGADYGARKFGHRTSLMAAPGTNYGPPGHSMAPPPGAYPRKFGLLSC